MEYVLPSIKTIAEFWDSEIEHCDAKLRWTNPALLDIACEKLRTKAPRKLDVIREFRKMAEGRAVEWEWDSNDKILTFEDGSRLAIVAFGANTMKGDSRVMEPGETSVRFKVRGGKPYCHGVTKSAWYWTTNGKKYGKTEPSPIVDREIEVVVSAHQISKTG